MREPNPANENHFRCACTLHVAILSMKCWFPVFRLLNGGRSPCARASHDGGLCTGMRLRGTVFFFATAKRKEASHSTRDAKRAPHKSYWSRLTRTEGGLNRPRAPARSHKHTFPEVSPTSWKRMIVAWSNPTKLSNARKTEDPGHGERLVLSQIPQERDGAGAPPSCHLECHHEEMAPGPGKQLVVPAAPVLFRLVDGLSLPATPRHAPTRQRRDDGGVNGDLLPSPEWKAVGDAGHLSVPRC